MGYRKYPTVTGYYYHIYNRGNNFERIYFEMRNYDFFLKRLQEYSQDVFEINAYCLMPNHYHIIACVLDDEKVPKAMHRLSTSYTKAINNSRHRVGHLFQGRYKIKLVPENNYLLHLSSYIHLNPVQASIRYRPEDWRFSSYRDYIGLRKKSIVNPSIILDQIDDYREFVEDFQEHQNLFVKPLLID